MSKIIFSKERWENGSGTAYISVFMLILAFTALLLTTRYSAVFAQREQTQLVVDAAADAAGVVLAGFEDSLDIEKVVNTAQDILSLNGINNTNSISSVGIYNEFSDDGNPTGFSLVKVDAGLKYAYLSDVEHEGMVLGASATVRAQNNTIFSLERLQMSYYDASTTADAIIREAKKYIGVPYHLGANYYDDGHLDCGLFVKIVLQQSGAYPYSDLGRTVTDIMNHPDSHGLPYQAFNNLAWSGALNGRYEELMEFLEPGDLLIFKFTYLNKVTHIPENPSHIGIYIGNGQMIHAGDPVKIVPLNFQSSSTYWSLHFRDAIKMPYQNLSPQLKWTTSPGNRDSSYPLYIVETFLDPERNDIYQSNGSEKYDYKFLYDYLICMGIDRDEYPPRTIQQWATEVFNDPNEQDTWLRTDTLADLQRAANEGKISFLLSYDDMNGYTAYIVLPTTTAVDENSLYTAHVGYENWNAQEVDFTELINTGLYLGIVHE